MKVNIKGGDQVLAKLAAMQNKALGDGTKIKGVVGFSQHYAIYVHENLNAYHPIGQAKYLEQPMRQNAKHMQAIMVQMLQNGKTLRQAILMACLFLQREAQQLVPVLTGALKNSAYTNIEATN